MLLTQIKSQNTKNITERHVLLKSETKNKKENCYLENLQSIYSIKNVFIKCDQKGALTKGALEVQNMQQIYSRTPMSRYDCHKVAKELY